jgi:predicted ribosomally synthesized peptide with SipW-like signal peptide
MSKKIGLTRRQALAGLGTIGAASVGAGVGTTALFSDTESFDGNTVTAGTLDMSVTATVEAASDYWEEQVTLGDLEATADGEAVTGLQVEDVKPGDWGVVCFEIEVGDNPGYVRTTTEGLTTAENGYTEPEPTEGDDENDPNDEAGAGELQDFMLAEVYQSFDASADGDPPRSHLSPSGGDPVAPEGSTVRDTYDAFSVGPLMRTPGGDPLVVGSGADAAEWCLLLYLPEDVGNRVQSDSFGFDLVFEAEQVRNNDNPFGRARRTLGTSAAQNTGFAAASGDGFVGDGYWGDDPSQTNQDGGSYEQLYVTFEQGFGPYYLDSLATFTVGDIESIRYRTRRPAGASQDYFMEIFTFPDGSNDDAGWYGRQLQALPGDALNRSVAPDTWLTWRTESGSNRLTFYDFNHDYDTGDSNSPPYLGQDTGVTLADLQSTGSFDWSDHVAAADDTEKNYRDEEVRAFRFATGSSWESSHEGDLDAIEIELTDGRSALVDLGP